MNAAGRPPACNGDAAAYALGALDEVEAQAFRRHADGCVVCRDELGSFERLVDVLPMSVPQHEAPRALRERVMREVRAEASASRVPAARPTHGGWRTPALAFGAAVVLALAVLAGSQLSGTSSTPVRLYRASIGDARLRVSDGHGELIVAHLPLPAQGDIYELWLLRRGSSAPAPTSALFSVTAAGTADVGVPGSLSGISKVLVTKEPAGGTEVPTSAPVIVADLA